MKRGEVWDVDLDPTTGAEIRKTRPCVIVSRDSMARLPLRIVVPLTEWDDRFMRAAWHVQIQPSMGNGLQKMSSADTFQVRSLSTARLVRHLGSMTRDDMERIDRALALSLALDG